MGANTTFSHTGLTPGSTYYYALYSYNDGKKYSAAATLSKLAISCDGLASGTYIPVPGDSDYSTDAFCVMKYEAKNVGGVATSQVSGTPWVNISQTSAKTACTSLGAGYALISNPEWMTLASNVANVSSNWSGGSVGSGALSSGHNDSSPNYALAAESDDNIGCSGTEQTCSSRTWNSQRRTHTLSNNEVIWDLAGNVWEWVDYNNVSNKPYVSSDGSPQAAFRELSAVDAGLTTMALTALRPTNALKNWWNDSWNSSQGFGQYYAGPNGSGGGLVRGARWANGSATGVFAAGLSSSTSWTDTNIGFRCVLRRPICGGAGDSCYDDTNAKTTGLAVTPLGKSLEYVFANGTSGFKVWKEVGGTRVLRANGLDEWAKALNIDGKGLSASEFTDANLGTASTMIKDRVCPPNVYIDDSNKFTTGNCLYYTPMYTSQSLSLAGTSQSSAGTIGLNNWSNYNGGAERWYVGNIETCSSKGMRLPTIFETNISTTSHVYYPTSDGSPTFAQSSGMPDGGNWTWTASSSTYGTNVYWLWRGSSLDNNFYGNSRNIVCVLP